MSNIWKKRHARWKAHKNTLASATEKKHVQDGAADRDKGLCELCGAHPDYCVYHKCPSSVPSFWSGKWYCVNCLDNHNALCWALYTGQTD